MDFFVSWQFIIFCLGISGIIYVIRTNVEYLLRNNRRFSKKSKIWRDLILPVLPVFVGICFAFLFKSYPYPKELSFEGGKIIFGIVSGLLSGLVYRVFKGVLYNKYNSVLLDESIIPNTQITIDIFPAPENTDNQNLNNTNK